MKSGWFDSRPFQSWQAEFFPHQYTLNIIPPKSRWRHHAFDLIAVN